MLQPAAPTIASAIALPGDKTGDQPAENGAPGAETGGFAKVLADQSQVVGATAQPAQNPSEALAEADPTAIPIDAQPIIAAPLPLAGKILPGRLPAQAGIELPAELSADQPASPDQTIPTLLAALRAIQRPQSVAVGPKSPRQAAGAEATEPAEAADPSLSGEPIAVASLLTTTITTTLTVTATAPNQTGLAANLPPLVQAQLLGQPLQQAAAAPSASTPPADTAMTLTIDPARAEPARTAQVPLSFAPTAAKPMAEARLRPVVGGEADRPARAVGPDVTDLLANPATAMPATATATMASQPSPSTSPLAAAAPRDFAALMDRLIAARDAAQTGLPQSVQVAVNHAEFGPISLNFQHDKAGLAVSVASPDPDVARAVQAAIPPAAAAAASGDSSSRDGQSGGRSGSQADGSAAQSFARADGSAAGQSGQRQSRGVPFPIDEAQPATNRSPATRRDAGPAGPRGIFV